MPGSLPHTEVNDRELADAEQNEPARAAAAPTIRWTMNPRSGPSRGTTADRGSKTWMSSSKNPARSSAARMLPGPDRMSCPAERITTVASPLRSPARRLLLVKIRMAFAGGKDVTFRQSAAVVCGVDHALDAMGVARRATVASIAASRGDLPRGCRRQRHRSITCRPASASPGVATRAADRIRLLACPIRHLPRGRANLRRWINALRAGSRNSGSMNVVCRPGHANNGEYAIPWSACRTIFRAVAVGRHADRRSRVRHRPPDQRCQPTSGRVAPTAAWHQRLAARICELRADANICRPDRRAHQAIGPPFHARG